MLSRAPGRCGRIAAYDVFDYIEVFYNRKRRHEHLGGEVSTKLGEFQRCSLSPQCPELSYRFNARAKVQRRARIIAPQEIEAQPSPMTGPTLPSRTAAGM